MLTQSTCQTINIHKVYSCNDWQCSCPLISEYVSTKTYSTEIFIQRILFEEYSQSAFFHEAAHKTKIHRLCQVSVGMFGSSTRYQKMIHIRIWSIALLTVITFIEFSKKLFGTIITQGLKKKVSAEYVDKHIFHSDQKVCDG